MPKIKAIQNSFSEWLFVLMTVLVNLNMIKDNSKKALIFIDVDGTLYTPELTEISPDFLDTIKNVRDKGHLVFLATGRASSFLPYGVYPDLFDGYVLAHGEQVLFGKKDIYLKFLPENLLKKLMAHFDKLGIDYVCYGKDLIYFNRLYSDLYKFLLTQGTDSSRFRVFDQTFSPSQILRIEAWDKDDINWDEFFGLYPDLKWAPDPESLRIDINLKEAKKSLGIKKILDYLDSQNYQTVCFGNALNDTDMFELADVAIAVENSDPRLKEKADLIAPSVLENGVGKTLEDYFV